MIGLNDFIIVVFIKYYGNKTMMGFAHSMQVTYHIYIKKTDVIAYTKIRKKGG
jgi:ribonucleotide reductase beta subunit family protein with ferritin-like domain